MILLILWNKSGWHVIAANDNNTRDIIQTYDTYDRAYAGWNKARVYAQMHTDKSNVTVAALKEHLK